MINGRLRALPGLLTRAPRPLLALVGLAAAVLGVLLITRPLSSVSVLAIYLGLSALASGLADLSAERRATRLLGLAWILLGLTVLVWLGRAITLLPTALAVALVVSGLARLATARAEPTWDARTATALFGLADLAFGVLALAWPDVTLVLVAVLFGARTLGFGLAQVWRAVRRPDDAAAPTGPASPGPASPSPASPGPWRRAGRTTGAVLTVTAAALALVLSGRLDAASPQVDAFYDAPADLPASPGVLLRAEPFDREVPEAARAWRILYTTTRGEEIAVASGLVVVPDAAPPAGEGHPVIAWAHGTTGYATQCAPSVLPEPFTAGALPALDQVMAQGWALVAADYIGLGTAGPQPYLIGEGEGRSVLDAVRAARELTDAALAPETVVWGHSQGGHAALWTGQLQPDYAPDVPLAGVVAMAPAADTLAVAANLPNVPGGSVFASFVAMAYSETYPDVDLDRYVTGSARTLVREMAARCLSEPGVLVSVLTALSLDRDRPIFAQDPATGPLGERLATNVPTGPVPAPLLIAQGGADSLITAADQDGYVAARCAAGQALDYRTYPGRDHMGLVAPDSALVPELLAWTQARLAGEPAADTCP